MEKMQNEVLVTTKENQIEQTQEDKNAIIDFKMVSFSLSDKDYAINIMHVKEIAKANHFTYVPNTLPFVLGVYNLRGEIIPILDLRLFFNVPVPEADEKRLENLLILSIDDRIFGVVVDKIDKVIGVQKSTIQPPHPLFGDINIKYIEGIIESNNRLYILLDVTKIFAEKEELEGNERIALSYSQPSAPVRQKIAEPAKPVQAAAAPVPKKDDVSEQKIAEGLSFIKDGLQKYKNFYVTSINEAWVRRRFVEWTKIKGENNFQFMSEADADEFLKPFWSSCTENWWSKEFADSLYALLPDNSAKQIVVWNPGCGKGCESYSFACLLTKRYPEAKIRIYAQDVDLLKVSNAALMSVPDELATDWYGPYLTKKANGEYTFSQEIKDSIMFEYHDCKNTNALPNVDFVFARDILSLLDEKSQDTVVADFLEKMKGNAFAIIGENEAMPSSFNFGENTVGALFAYTKD